MKEKLNTATGKKILSLVRNGNYAHPGEEEAIELAFSQYKKDGSRRLLDIGCGLFGTAKYLGSHGYGKVTMIDVNEGDCKSCKRTNDNGGVNIFEYNVKQEYSLMVSKTVFLGQINNYFFLC